VAYHRPGDKAVTSLRAAADKIGGNEGRYLKMLLLTGKRKSALGLYALERWRTFCPEGTLGELPAECGQFAREYFVRRPRSNIWVWIGALPKPTRTALWKKRIKNYL
jgi:hypothetical protein